MKYLAIVLSVFLLFLSLVSCSDGYSCTYDTGEHTATHDHSEDQNDQCPPLCFCACCGLKVSVEEPLVLVETSSVLPRGAVFFMPSFYAFTYLQTRWRPPSVS